MTVEKRILLSIYGVSFAGPFVATALTVAIPRMAAEFGVLPNRLSEMIAFFLMATAAALLPCGKLSDIYGRRNIYTKALLLFLGTTIAAAGAPTLPWLLGCYIIQGLALAAIYVSYMPLLLAMTPEDRQGHVLGRAVALTYGGLSCGPVMGGLLLQTVSWRYIFLITAVLIAMSYVAIRPVKGEWYAKGAPFVNIVSTLLSAPAIMLCLYGISAASPLLWVGLVLLGLFIFHESRSYHPILPLYIFRNLTFSLANLASFIQYSATYAVSFLVSLYAQLVLHLSPAMTGLLLVVQPIFIALLSTKAGDLADTYSGQYVSAGGLFITTLGLGALAFTDTHSLVTLTVYLGILGIGTALFGAPNNKTIMSAVKPAYHGLAASMLALARNLGQAISMALVTLFLTSQAARLSDYSLVVATTFHTAFLVFTILCALAMVCSLIRRQN